MFPWRGTDLRAVINSKSKTFMAFCFCFMAGVACASLTNFLHKFEYLIYVVLFISLFALAYAWNSPVFRFFSFMIIFIILGIFRYSYSIPEINDSSQLPYYFDKRLTLSATIVEDPTQKINSTEYILGQLSERGEIKRKMLLTMPPYPEYNFNNHLRITCSIRAPENFSDFRYDRYLSAQGIWAVCDSPEIVSVFTVEKKSIYGYMLHVKDFIRRKVAELWPEPNSSFVAGIIYGERSGFTSELNENFRRTGLTHIVAVSGYNVSIIAGLLLSIFIYFGLYRRPALIAAFIGVILFVFFVGASASAIRAGIMGSIVLISQYIGRPSRAFYALVIAAGLMISYNPQILIWDAGFQLSCIATAGIIFAPKTEKKWLEPAVITLAATIATLPLILAQFGQFSLVSLPVNLLVVWLIPWLMIGGFVSVIISFIYFPMAFIFASLVNFGLDYVIIIVNKFSTYKYASIEAGFSLWQMICAYVMIILLTYKYAQAKNKSI